MPHDYTLIEHKSAHDSLFHRDLLDQTNNYRFTGLQCLLHLFLPLKDFGVSNNLRIIELCSDSSRSDADSSDVLPTLPFSQTS